MNPKVFSLIPKNKSYGMDDVIKKAMKRKEKMIRYWIERIHRYREQGIIQTSM